MPRHSTQTLAEPHYHGHYELGILAQDVRRYRMAIARYRREIALTNFYKAHYNLGTILQERKRYAEALKEYKEAVRKCPRFVAAHNNMGIIYTGLKQYHRAIQAFSRAILIDKTNALFFFNLGFTYATAGQYPKAVTTLRKALALEPRHSGAMGLLGGVLIEEGILLAEGISLLRRARKAAPGDPQDLACLAVGYLKQGRFARASRLARRAKALAPNDQFVLEQVRRVSRAMPCGSG